MGKASFANVADRNGNIQLYVSKDDLGDEGYKAFKKFDIGDIVGVKGRVFKTQKGEISSSCNRNHSFLSRAYRFFQRNITVLRIQIRDIVRDMLTLSLTLKLRTTFEKRSAIL